MKILQIISGLGNGGAEKFVVELSNQLAKEHDVTICSFKKVEPWMEFPKQISKNIRLIDANKKPGFDVSLYVRLYKIIKLQKPSVIHFHLDATLKYILPLVIIFPKIKFLHTLHSDVNREKVKIFKQLNKLKFILKKVKLVTITSNIQAEVAKVFPKLPIYMIENGICSLTYTSDVYIIKEEILKLKKNEDTFVAITIGRLDENKNQELLIKVFNSIENAILLIIGDDPSMDKNYFNKLKSIKTNNIHILGTRTNVADYLAHSDVFVFSSHNEGLPISVLEAMSIGLPIITTPAGGLKSIIKNKINGFVAEDWEIESMKKIIHNFIKLNPEEKTNIKKNNLKEFNKKYNMEICCANYLNLYNS